jgi:hypothetical protein
MSQLPYRRLRILADHVAGRIYPDTQPISPSDLMQGDGRPVRNASCRWCRAGLLYGWYFQSNAPERGLRCSALHGTACPAAFRHFRQWCVFF